MSWILDFRDKDDIPLSDSPTLGSRARLNVPGNAVKERGEKKLYPTVYKLFVLYSAWCGLGWALFITITNRETESMERHRWLVAFVAVGAAIGALFPWKGVGERERSAMRK